MGNDANDLDSLYSAPVGIVAKFSDKNYEMLRAFRDSAAPGNMLNIEQPGAWPEFLFKGTVISLDIDGDLGQWIVVDVSMMGVTLLRLAS